MTSDVVAEVEQQYQLRARWWGMSAQPAVLEALRSSYTHDFSLMNSAGRIIDRLEYMDALAGTAHSRPGLEIRTSEVSVVVELSGAVLVRFLETETEEHGRTLSRRVSALLLAASDAPHGLRWRHVQETTIPN